jgi:probable rRNA maturation factor
MVLKIKNETREVILYLSEILKDVFSSLNLNSSLSIIIVNDERIRQLNNDYRHVDKVTDVLSFESDEEGYLGDIFIDIYQAAIQAKQLNHALEGEILYLSLHGFFHLLSFDHESEYDDKIMHSLVTAIIDNTKYGDLKYNGNNK